MNIRFFLPLIFALSSIQVAMPTAQPTIEELIQSLEKVQLQEIMPDKKQVLLDAIAYDQSLLHGENAQKLTKEDRAKLAKKAELYKTIFTHPKVFAEKIYDLAGLVEAQKRGDKAKILEYEQKLGFVPIKWWQRRVVKIAAMAAATVLVLAGVRYVVKSEQAKREKAAAQEARELRREKLKSGNVEELIERYKDISLKEINNDAWMFPIYIDQLQALEQSLSSKGDEYNSLKESIEKVLRKKLNFADESMKIIKKATEAPQQMNNKVIMFLFMPCFLQCGHLYFKKMSPEQRKEKYGEKIAQLLADIFNGPGKDPNISSRDLASNLNSLSSSS